MLNQDNKRPTMPAPLRSGWAVDPGHPERSVCLKHKPTVATRSANKNSGHRHKTTSALLQQIRGESVMNNKKLLLSCTFLLTLALGGPEVVGQTLPGETNKEKYRRAIAKDIPYGKEKVMVGILAIKDRPRLGPESFCNDFQGNLYICDGVNQRIQIFSSNGEHETSVPLRKGITASDVAIDRHRLTYVYDDVHGKLYQIDGTGAVLGFIDVDAAQWQCRGSLHIVGDNIYIATADQEDVLIATVGNGLLAAPGKDEGLRLVERGIHALSGRKYFVKLTRWEKAEIEVMGKDGVTVSCIELPKKGIVSIRFLEEDRKGNFYVQTETAADGKILLEVHKFDSNGRYSARIPIPETDYYSWSIKLLSVDTDGNVFQFLPANDRARLSVFQQEQ
jgi:hypothetical protein